MISILINLAEAERRAETYTSNRILDNFVRSVKAECYGYSARPRGRQRCGCAATWFSTHEVNSDAGAILQLGENSIEGSACAARDGKN